LSIEIVRHQPNEDKAWDEFVWSANNGNIFHTRQFLNYHPKDRFVDYSLTFYKKGKRIAQLPAIEYFDKNKKRLVSHRGASYGGFVVKDTLSIQNSFELVEEFLKYAKTAQFDEIDMTPPPQVYLHRPSNYIDFALVQNGFSYRKREVSSVIPLDFSRDKILTTFNEGSRRAVRRGKKLGVVVKESQKYQEFYDILEKNLRLRHNVAPTHTLDELLLLKDLFPERIKLFGAFKESTMVAGVVMFICNPQVVLAFYISHNEDFQEFRGVNVLFFDIIDWGIAQGYKFLDFGIFTVNEDPNWGLARFKESFGAQGIFRDSFIKIC
jgi:hypothetical protein